MHSDLAAAKAFRREIGRSKIGEPQRRCGVSRAAALGLGGEFCRLRVVFFVGTRRVVFFVGTPAGSTSPTKRVAAPCRKLEEPQPKD